MAWKVSLALLKDQKEEMRRIEKHKKWRLTSIVKINGTYFEVLFIVVHKLKFHSLDHILKESERFRRLDAECYPYEMFYVRNERK